LHCSSECINCFSAAPMLLAQSLPAGQQVAGLLKIKILAATFHLVFELEITPVSVEGTSLSRPNRHHLRDVIVDGGLTEERRGSKLPARLPAERG